MLPKLIEIPYSFDQATKNRRPPPLQIAYKSYVNQICFLIYPKIASSVIIFSEMSLHRNVTNTKVSSVQDVNCIGRVSRSHFKVVGAVE